MKLAFNAGFTVDEIATITGMEPWFLRQMEDIHNVEAEFIEKGYSVIRKMKQFGFSNRQLAYLSSKTEIDSILDSETVVSKIKSKVNSILVNKEQEVEDYLIKEKSFQFTNELILVLVSLKLILLIFILLMIQKTNQMLQMQNQ